MNSILLVDVALGSVSNDFAVCGRVLSDRNVAGVDAVFGLCAAAVVCVRGIARDCRGAAGELELPGD